MKRAFTYLAILLFSTGLLAAAGERVGEKQNYKLDDSSRTSWPISDGSYVRISFTDYQDDKKLGPSYKLHVEYLFDLGLFGDEKGSFNLLVPERILGEEFQGQLKLNHPMDVQSFKMDYKGMSVGFDAHGKNYGQCPVFSIYNLVNEFMPGLEKGPKPPLDEISLKIHPSAPVLGAVQIDIKGTFMGFPYHAGFDLTN